jgi:hypothetical protein
MFLSPSMPHLSCPLSPSSTHYFLLYIFPILIIWFITIMIITSHFLYFTFFLLSFHSQFFTHCFISSVRCPHHTLNKRKIFKRQLTSWALYIKHFEIFYLRDSWLPEPYTLNTLVFFI